MSHRPSLAHDGLSRRQLVKRIHAIDERPDAAVGERRQPVGDESRHAGRPLVGGAHLVRHAEQRESLRMQRLQVDDDPPPSKGAARSVAVEDAYKEHSALLRDIAEKKFNIPAHDADGIVNDVFSSFMVHRDNVRDARQWLVGAVCHASRGYWRTAARTSSAA